MPRRRGPTRAQQADEEMISAAYLECTVLPDLENLCREAMYAEARILDHLPEKSKKDFRDAVFVFSMIALRVKKYIAETEMKHSYYHKMRDAQMRNVHEQALREYRAERFFAEP